MDSKINTNEIEDKSKVPHIYVILYVMIILGAFASYVIPQGAFDRELNETGQEVIIPGSFHYTDDSPVSIMNFITSLAEGMISSSAIVFGILLIGGMFAVIEKAGLIELGVYKLATLFSNNVLWVLPTLMIPIAIFTAFTGNAELMLVYIPVVVPLALKMGFDRITAAGIVLVSVIPGFAVALTAPANLGTAQLIAQVPLYSGMVYRVIILAVMLLVGILFVWRYAKMVYNDPIKSIVYEEEKKIEDVEEIIYKKATIRQIIASILLIPALAILLIGLIKYQWFFTELIGLYAVVGIIIGLVVGMRFSEIAETFQEGFQNVLIGALVVGLARGVAVILENGYIMDTIIYGAEKLVTGVPNGFTAIIMLVVQSGLNLIINSGSGQALVTMPIMSGLADLTGISQQTAVLAFLFGDGLSNIIYPTSGAFMATLIIAKIKWEKWVKFILPLFIIWHILAAIFLVIAEFINY